MDCLTFVQGLHSFVACFCGARFLRWSYVYSMRKSTKKKLTTIFHQLWSQNAGNGILEAQILNLFPGQHATYHRTSIEAHTCGDHGHGYAGPRTASFLVAGPESLKLAFLKFNLKFNSAAFWIIQLQTHQEHLQLPQGWGISAISCPAWWGICRFLRGIKTNPHLYPGVGWVGVYFDWCITFSIYVQELTYVSDTKEFLFPNVLTFNMPIVFVLRNSWQ